MSKKRAVLYGAGNIGRGFLGQLMHMSDYEITFIDVNPALIEGLNREGKYPIFITEGDTYRPYWVTHVRAVDGRDIAAVADSIANADLMATAVGVNVLPRIALPMAEGIRLRRERGIQNPLNVIVCENLIGADQYLANLIKEKLDGGEQDYFDRMIGLVEPSIGRMVPATPENIAKEYPLAVCVEHYCELPVDREGFRGEIPSIAHMVPYSPFDFLIRRKLFLHNMSHALVAYLGALRGYIYIWEAVADREIRLIARQALGEASHALAMEYGVDLSELNRFSEDLLARYENRLLGDTVVRVGRDTKRKLAPNDRFMGAVRLCEKHGICPTSILMGLAAGLSFAPEGDGSSAEVVNSLRCDGLSKTLETYCGLEQDSPLVSVIAQLMEQIVE